MTPPPSLQKPSTDTAKADFSVSESDESDLLGGPSTTPPKNEPIKETVKEVVKEDNTPEDVNTPEPAKDTVDKKTLIKDIKKGDTKVVESKETPDSDDTTGGPNLLKTLDEKKKAAPRDYTGFAEDEVKALKSMSNEAFNYIAPILKGRKELEKLKDASYLQHPESYTLHPEYRDKQRLMSHARREASEWQKALVAIRKGEEWSPLVGVDKDGNFIYGEKRKATVEDEEEVRKAMNQCVSTEQQTAKELQQLPTRFQQQVTADHQSIQAERARRFDWVANPELLKHELDTENGKKTVGTLKDEFTSLFPLYHQKSIGVEVASDLWVAMQVLSARLKIAEQGKAVAEVLKEEAVRVEPTSGNRPVKGGAGRNGKEFNMDGLPE